MCMSTSQIRRFWEEFLQNNLSPLKYANTLEGDRPHYINDKYSDAKKHCMRHPKQHWVRKHAIIFIQMVSLHPFPTAIIEMTSN